MKKSLLFLIVFLLGSLPVFAASFPDVAKDHKNYDAIEYLDEHQIINGYKDGTFGPDNLLNRAEAMKIITLAFDIKTDAEYEVLFPDVLKEDWFFPYVMSAQKNGIIKGYENGKFKPANSINLAETLKMLIASSAVELPATSDGIFADVKSTDWFAPYMLYARNHNLLISDDYGAIHPDQAMNRADFAELVYRMMIVKESDGKSFPIDKDWSSYKGSTVPFSIKYDSARWQIIEHNDEVIFMRPDKEFSQFSAVRMYPNSAFVNVTLDENELDMAKDQYFENVKAAFKGAQYKNFDLGTFKALEVLYPEKRIVDWYIYLSDGKVLVAYTQYGDGILGYQHQQFIKSMLQSINYSEIDKEPAPDYSAMLSDIFKNILIEGKGMDMLDLLPDKKIIETDVIGVGTGPVDYYYSEGVNYTFKYERSTNVILDKREGETAKF